MVLMHDDRVEPFVTSKGAIQFMHMEISLLPDRGLSPARYDKVDRSYPGSIATPAIGLKWSTVRQFLVEAYRGDTSRKPNPPSEFLGDRELADCFSSAYRARSLVRRWTFEEVLYSLIFFQE
jgi:hypothetical protein